MLEVVQTITEPLLAKLRFHFASGRPTDRMDQPDWLFDTAAKATQENLEAFKVLQPAVEQHGLERVFYLPFEFARAMHAAVQTVLKEHVLPRLAQQVHLHQIACMFVCPVTLWSVLMSYHTATCRQSWCTYVIRYAYLNAVSIHCVCLVTTTVSCTFTSLAELPVTKVSLPCA